MCCAAAVVSAGLLSNGFVDFSVRAIYYHLFIECRADEFIYAREYLRTCTRQCRCAHSIM